MSNREDVYGAFVDYYGDLPFKKLKIIDQQWVVYAAASKTGLAENRYLFAIVPFRNAYDESITLNNLDWVSFQTRVSDENHQVPGYQLYLNEERKEAMNDLLKVLERDQQCTRYITHSLPISVQLLHDPKKNNHLQYPDQCRLYQALETFRCVVEIL